MNNKRKMLVACFAIVAFATPAVAWMGNWQENAVSNRSALSAEQQQQVQQIENRYDKGLKEMEAQLDAKQDELLAARSDDATTVGRLNELESELYKLERAYWTKRDQANMEVSRVTGGRYDSRFACDYRGCDHDNGRHGMMRDGYSMSGRNMSSESDGSCCR